MKLSQLIEQLQSVKTENGDMEVEFTIPAHENSYEGDYTASNVTKLAVWEMSVVGVKSQYLEMEMQ